MASRITKAQKQQNEESARDMSNRMLLEETISASQGDDYDGCFTAYGSHLYKVLSEELERRLSKWLNSTDKEAH